MLDANGYRPWVVVAATLMWLLSGIVSLGFAIFLLGSVSPLERLGVAAWGIVSLGMAYVARSKARVEYSPMTVGGLPVLSDAPMTVSASAESRVAATSSAQSPPRTLDPDVPASSGRPDDR